MELNEMERRMLYQTEGSERYAVIHELLMCLLALETFDKDKLLTVIDRVLVYSEERIEIIWKMNDGFFSETAGGKKWFHCNKAM